ncbi:MarR family transcriptional regulator [Pseudonocardia sp. CNS-139]|nr:MarR family transcriptional regulator [Pseudonocardia sp. CNS-139]
MSVTTPQSVEHDFGWALGTVMRSYMNAADLAVGGVPGGPRGYQVLSAAAKGEPRSQLALAQHLGVDRTVMTYLLDDLEREGLVERRPDPADRRARRVILTAAGTERLCDLERRLHTAEEQVLGPLDPDEREVLRRMLHRLATKSGTHVGDLCSVAEDIRRA